MKDQCSCVQDKKLSLQSTSFSWILVNEILEQFLEIDLQRHFLFVATGYVKPLGIYMQLVFWFFNQSAIIAWNFTNLVSVPILVFNLIIIWATISVSLYLLMRQRYFGEKGKLKNWAKWEMPVQCVQYLLTWTRISVVYSRFILYVIHLSFVS